MYIFYSYQITTTRSLTGTSFVFLLFTKMIKYHHPVSPLSAIIILFSYLYKKQNKEKRESRFVFHYKHLFSVYCLLIGRHTIRELTILTSSRDKNKAHITIFSILVMINTIYFSPAIERKNGKNSNLLLYNIFCALKNSTYP